MTVEEFIYDTKKKNDKKEIESILRMYIDDEKIRNIILKDAFQKDNIIIFNNLYYGSEIFSDKMREEVEPLNVKEKLFLLRVEYEALEKKCWNELIKKLPNKLVYLWDKIIYENMKILSNIQPDYLDFNLINEIVKEKNLLENLFNLYDKISYEEIKNDTMALLEEHLKLQRYAMNKKLLDA